MNESRAIRSVDVRAAATPGTVVARVMTYGTVDDYGTIFDPGCFDRSLEARMPVFAWGHDWTDPIGRATRVVRNDDQVLEVEFRLDVGTAVPRADQAYAQIRSGTIDEFSVGFRRNAGGTYTDGLGVEHFVSVRLDEVSCVLAGAVPGTGVLAVRSRVDDALRRVRAAAPAVRHPDTAEAHRRWLRDEYRAGRLTREQLLDDLRVTDAADAILEKLGLG